MGRAPIAGGTTVTRVLSSWADPFDRQVWAVVAALLSFSSMAMLFFEGHAQNHGDFGPEYLHWTRRLGRGFYKCMMSYTMTGSFEPMTPAGRFYSVVFSFVVLLVQSAYTANLAGALPTTQHPAGETRAAAPAPGVKCPHDAGRSRLYLSRSRSLFTGRLIPFLSLPLPCPAFFTRTNVTTQLIQNMDTFAVRGEACAIQRGRQSPPQTAFSRFSRPRQFCSGDICSRLSMMCAPPVFLTHLPQSFNYVVCVQSGTEDVDWLMSRYPSVKVRAQSADQGFGIFCWQSKRACLISSSGVMTSKHSVRSSKSRRRPQPPPLRFMPSHPSFSSL